MSTYLRNADELVIIVDTYSIAVLISSLCRIREFLCPFIVEVKLYNELSAACACLL